MQPTGKWKARLLVIGAAAGALLGAGTAYLLIRRSEQEARPLELGAGESLRLGLLMLGLLKQVSELGEPRK
jgi:hypothetical protein